MSLGAYAFSKLRIPKTLLHKCLKSHVPKDPSTINMVDGIEQGRNLNDTIFTIFLDHSGGNQVQKSLS